MGLDGMPSGVEAMAVPNALPLDNGNLLTFIVLLDDQDTSSRLSSSQDAPNLQEYKPSAIRRCTQVRFTDAAVW